MKLSSPFFISSRLLPALKVGNGTIQLVEESVTPEVRIRYRWTIDISIPEGEKTYTDNDMCSCVGGDTLQKAFKTLVAFLAAAGSSYRYQLDQIKKEISIDSDSNAALFPKEVSEWAYQYSDELSCLACELEENKDLIIE